MKLMYFCDECKFNNILESGKIGLSAGTTVDKRFGPLLENIREIAHLLLIRKRTHTQTCAVSLFWVRLDLTKIEMNKTVSNKNN